MNMKRVEFLIIDTETGDIKYRNRRTMSLHPDSYPEKVFELWSRNMIALFRNQDDEKYKHCICQISCEDDKKAVQGSIFPIDLMSCVPK